MKQSLLVRCRSISPPTCYSAHSYVTGERCTSTGRKCDGYEFPKKNDQQQEQQLKRSPSAVSPPSKRPTLVPVYNNLVLPTSLSQPFEGTLQEKRLFHRFQVRTVPSFAGGSESNFWTKVVLRAGQEEPVVRNAIIALGALHEDYQIRSGKYDAQLIEDRSYRDVTLLYGKALRQLNQRLNEPTQENAKIAIICSILFACFEVLRRNNMAAVVHYQQGMRQLMRQMALPTPSPSPTDTEPSSVTTYSNKGQSLTVRFREIPEDELDDIMRVFARYDIQACTFSKDRAEPLHVDTSAPRSLPALTELTLPQVRTHLDNLLICVYQLIKSDLKMYRYWDLASVPPLWQHRRATAIKVFEDWSAALEQFFTTAEGTLPPQEAKSLLGLRLQIHVAIIELKMAIDHKPETSYDAFRSDFSDMVARVEKLFGTLALHDARPLDIETVDFTMELGLIHPLFFIAAKCRDWNIRRRAVALLRKAGKEGVWEGPIMAVLATKIMRLEEQNCARGTLVPERNRFHEVKK